MKNQTPLKKRALRILAVYAAVMCIFAARSFAQEDYNLEDVTVKGKIRPERSSVQKTVITREEIQKMNVSSVQEAIKYLTGVQVRKSRGGDRGAVEIHGLDASYSVILIDGQEYRGAQGGGVDLDSISLDSIERIELIKGPVSALYSSRALGGVVNIITREKHGSGFSLSLVPSAGSRNTASLDFNTGYSGEGNKTMLNYSNKSTDGRYPELVEQDPGSGTYSYYSDITMQQLVSMNMSYALGSKYVLQLTPLVSRYITPAGDYGQVNQSLLNKTNMRNQDRTSLNTQLNYFFQGGTTINGRVSYLDYKNYTTDLGSDWVNGIFEEECKVVMPAFNLLELTLGQCSRNETMDNRHTRISAASLVYSLYIQGEMNNNFASMTIGDRVDFMGSGSKENPKLVFALGLFEGFKARVSFGRSTTLPTMVQLYGDKWRWGPYLMNPNPNLEMSSSDYQQYGLDINISKNIMMKASTFKQDNTNLVDYTIDRSSIPWQINWLNVDKILCDGVETTFDFIIGKNINLNVGYTYLFTRVQQTGKALMHRPIHRLATTLDYTLPFGLTVNVTGEYNGERYDDILNIVPLPPYAVLNLALTQSFTPGFQIFLKFINITGVTNVLDEYDLDGMQYLAGVRLQF